MSAELRHRCRNQNCRTKLKSPVDNHHKAFCTPFCYTQFYSWKCKVCEKPILKGKRRKQPDHCHARDCRKAFRTYPEAFGYPYSPTVNYDFRSAHFAGVKIGLRDLPDWHWDDTKAEGEHWLYAHGRVVAIIAEVDRDDYRISYPYMYPAQGASTPDAARKLAIEIALWTTPVGGIKPKPAEVVDDVSEEQLAKDLADEKYVTEDEERLRKYLGRVP
jgi:hypothetical protein